MKDGSAYPISNLGGVMEDFPDETLAELVTGVENHIQTLWIEVAAFLVDLVFIFKRDILIFVYF
jgi:hypothetical protein